MREALGTDLSPIRMVKLFSKFFFDQKKAGWTSPHAQLFVRFFSCGIREAFIDFCGFSQSCDGVLSILNELLICFEIGRSYHRLILTQTVLRVLHDDFRHACFQSTHQPIAGRFLKSFVIGGVSRKKIWVRKLFVSFFRSVYDLKAPAL